MPQYDRYEANALPVYNSAFMPSDEWIVSFAWPGTVISVR